MSLLLSTLLLRLKTCKVYTRRCFQEFIRKSRRTFLPILALCWSASFKLIQRRDQLQSKSCICQSSLQSTTRSERTRWKTLKMKTNKGKILINFWEQSESLRIWDCYLNVYLNRTMRRNLKKIRKPLKVIIKLTDPFISSLLINNYIQYRRRIHNSINLT